MGAPIEQAQALFDLLLDRIADHGAQAIDDGIGRRQVEQRPAATRALHAAQLQHRCRLTIGVQPEAGLQRTDAQARQRGQRIAGAEGVVHQRAGAAGQREPDRQRGQGAQCARAADGNGHHLGRATEHQPQRTREGNGHGASAQTEVEQTLATGLRFHRRRDQRLDLGHAHTDAPGIGARARALHRNGHGRADTGHQQLLPVAEPAHHGTRRAHQREEPVVEHRRAACGQVFPAQARAARRCADAEQGQQLVDHRRRTVGARVACRAQLRGEQRHGGFDPGRAREVDEIGQRAVARRRLARQLQAEQHQRHIGRALDAGDGDAAAHAAKRQACGAEAVAQGHVGRQAQRRRFGSDLDPSARAGAVGGEQRHVRPQRHHEVAFGHAPFPADADEQAPCGAAHDEEQAGVAIGPPNGNPAVFVPGSGQAEHLAIGLAHELAQQFDDFFLPLAERSREFGGGVARKGFVELDAVASTRAQQARHLADLANDRVERIGSEAGGHGGCASFRPRCERCRCAPPRLAHASR